MNATSACFDADGHQHRLEPVHSQWIMLYWFQFCFYFMLIGWNLKYVRAFLYPWKLATVALHECCHAIMAVVTCASVTSIQLDVYEGGATDMRGGWAFLTLPAGYVGSTAIGSALVFASFDAFASKVVVWPVSALLLLVTYWARKSGPFTIASCLMPIGTFVLFYVIAHSVLLRFVVMFLGTMNIMYAVWDIMDDLVFHKIKASDCYQFYVRYPWIPAQAWGFVWFLFAAGAVTGSLLSGIAFFKDNFSEQALHAQSFLPT